MRNHASFLTAVFCCWFLSGAQAQEPTGTLKKIRDSGTISLGYRESSLPFSYYDSNIKVVGSSKERAAIGIDAIKKKLNLPNLQVKMVPVTSGNRIPLVQNGTVDIEAGSTTNNLDREKQVSFSNTMFIIGTRLLVKKGSNVKDFPDLKGKTVVTTAGDSTAGLPRAGYFKNRPGGGVSNA